MTNLKTVKILKNNNFLYVERMDFKKILSQAPFGVFLEFTDPRTNTLIQKEFPFWCKPQKTFKPMGNVFFTQWRGLALTIPADFDWWVMTQSVSTYSRRIDQKVQFIKEGEYVDVQLRVEMMGFIRMDPVFSPEIGWPQPPEG
ncbi:TPA: hypothetical protein QHR73_002053 [Morganella morganii subsp. morganii]|nr:hypothetical protein [Morganella morganii subsp. morganii]